MFAHQVVDDLNFLIKSCIKNGYGAHDELFLDSMRQMVFSIKTAIKFNIENSDNVYDMFSKNIGKPIFNTENSKYQKMPYKKVWLDWERKPQFSDVNDDKPVIILKRGILACEIMENLIDLKVFNFIQDIKYFGKKIWIPSTIGAIFSVGHTLKENEYFVENFIKNDRGFITKVRDLNAIVDGNTFVYKLAKDKSIDSSYKEALIDNNPDYSLFDSFLILINCKNILTDKIYPSTALNKKRTTIGKQPLFTYHTLSVNLMGTNPNGNRPHETTGIKQRVHFCRGHFKEYTESNKLFGRHTGLYWWQPMVRGNKDIGVIYKDYKINVKSNQQQ